VVTSSIHLTESILLCTLDIITKKKAKKLFSPVTMLTSCHTVFKNVTVFTTKVFLCLCSTQLKTSTVHAQWFA